MSVERMPIGTSYFVAGHGEPAELNPGIWRRDISSPLDHENGRGPSLLLINGLF